MLDRYVPVDKRRAALLCSAFVVSTVVGGRRPDLSAVTGIHVEIAAATADGTFRGRRRRRRRHPQRRRKDATKVGKAGQSRRKCRPAEAGVQHPEEKGHGRASSMECPVASRAACRWWCCWRLPATAAEVLAAACRRLCQRFAFVARSHQAKIRTSFRCRQGSAPRQRWRWARTRCVSAPDGLISDVDVVTSIAGRRLDHREGLRTWRYKPQIDSGSFHSLEPAVRA